MTKTLFLKSTIELKFKYQVMRLRSFKFEILQLLWQVLTKTLVIMDVALMWFLSMCNIIVPWSSLVAGFENNAPFIFKHVISVLFNSNIKKWQLKSATTNKMHYSSSPCFQKQGTTTRRYATGFVAQNEILCVLAVGSWCKLQNLAQTCHTSW